MGKYYNLYNFYNIKSEDASKFSSLVLLNGFKTIQQSKDNTCAPCCAIMVLNYFDDNRFTQKDEMRLAKMMGTKPFPYGTDLKNFVEFFNKISDDEHQYQYLSSIDYKKDKNGLCFSTFKQFKKFVLDNLKKGYPIIVENVDYGGHYKIIIGYDEVSKNSDEDILIFADSEDINDEEKDGYNIFPADRFYYMWFDDHCLSNEYRKQPFIVVKRIK